MIIQTYHSNKSKGFIERLFTPKASSANIPVYNGKRQPTDRDKRLAEKQNITPEEVVRRDDLVRQHWIDCPFHVNEVLWPVSPEDRREYGHVTLRGIVKSYHELSLDDWREGDVPMICAVEPSKHPKKVICCTASWLSRFKDMTC